MLKLLLAVIASYFISALVVEILTVVITSGFAQLLLFVVALYAIIKKFGLDKALLTRIKK